MAIFLLLEGGGKEERGSGEGGYIYYTTLYSEREIKKSPPHLI
jgi:hypothetical protein